MNCLNRSSVISGLGKALPKKLVTNHELSKFVDTSDEWIKSHTGIESRHIADEDELCSVLATNAAREALAQSQVDPNHIGLVIVATATPDYRAFPSTACLVQEALGLKNAGAFDLVAACSGFVYGLELAHSMIVSGAQDHILVIGAEVLSSILNWKDRNTCVLFGDGAGAAVISLSTRPNCGILGSFLRAKGSGAEALIVPYGGSKNRPTENKIELRDNWDDLYIQMDGRQVYMFAVKALVETIDALLQQHHLEKEEIDYIIPHQANNRIIQAAAKRSGIPIEKFFVNLYKTGNTSAASIPLALNEMNTQNLLKENHKILTIGFGAGLTYGGNYIVW